MKKIFTVPALALILAGATLSANTLACQDEAKHAAHDAAHTHSTDAAATPATPAAEGMVVTRDAATGQMRAPTAAERQELDNKAKSDAARKSQSLMSGKVRSLAAPAAPAAPAARTHASGAKGMRLGDEHATFSVVTRQADGSLINECVEGKDAADAAVKQGLPAKTTSSQNQE